MGHASTNLLILAEPIPDLLVESHPAFKTGTQSGYAVVTPQEIIDGLWEVTQDNRRHNHHDYQQDERIGQGGDDESELDDLDDELDDLDDEDLGGDDDVEDDDYDDDDDVEDDDYDDDEDY